MTTDFEIENSEVSPEKGNKNFIPNSCELKFLRINRKTLLFKFKYGSIPMIINLLNRDLDWIRDISKSDVKAILYPEHFRNKLN